MKTIAKNVQERIDFAATSKPVNHLSYELLLCYRNCRYLQREGLPEQAMTILARVIWADEDGAVADVDKAKVLEAFGELFELADTAEGATEDEIEMALVNLHEVAAVATPADHRYRDEDRRWLRLPRRDPN